MAWQETLAWPRLVLFMVVVFVLLTTVAQFAFRGEPLDLESQNDNDLNALCPLPRAVITPDDHVASSDLFNEQAVLLQQVERLSAAVNISTVSYDDNGDVEEDPRWRTFDNLHSVLERLFPFVHKHMELEKVNKYGLLYTLRGQSQDLKPTVFMAHQDVVPAADDAATWTHPPFQAYYDGEWLWGRGSVDCKNNLVGLLSAMEKLLEQGFENKRTTVFSFGFDEETGGQRGAKYLAQRLEEKFGANGVAMIFDEGGMGIQQIGDVAYARTAVAEKGFIDLVMDLRVPGGHSSRPPPHTAIGIMSRLVATLEDNPFKPHLDGDNPFRNYLECQVQHSPGQVESWLRKSLLDGDDIAARLIKSRGEDIRWSFQTSQAVDVMRSGEKDNQLPESATAIVNYRVLPSDDMDALPKALADLLAPVAHKHGIAVQGSGYDEEDTGSGVLTVSYKDKLPPSPISNTGRGDAVWNMFASTVRHVFENRHDAPNSTSLVVPLGDIMTGNTDTVHYWNLSENIYRFSPRWEGTTEGVHTIDERINMRTHIEGIRLYYEMIRNLDAFTE